MESSSVQKNQEISFIDLLAVLIRYRVLIILGTLIFTGVAVLYTVILPKIFPFMNTRSITMTYTLEIRELPSDVQRILSNYFKQFSGKYHITDHVPSPKPVFFCRTI